MQPVLTEIGVTVPVLKKGVYLQEKEGQYLLLAPEAFWVLNDVAWEVLHLCDGRRDIESIVDALMEEYKGDRETIREDIVAFLTELNRDGYLEFQPPQTR